MSKKTRILIIRLSALGDVAMTVPVIYSFAKEYPETEITVLTRSFFARMFVNAPSNVGIFKADFKAEYKGLKGMWKLMRQLSAKHFDFVADFHNVLRSWEIDNFLRLRGSKVAMVDKARKERKSLLQHKIDSQPSFIERYIATLGKLGFDVTLDFKSIFGSSTPIPPIEIRHKAIGIAPFARYSNKTYPIELMEEVVKLIAEKCTTSGNGQYVYLFGGRGKEQEILDDWGVKYRNVTSMAGKFSLEEELAAMANLDVMLSMDSANQHLASLTGIKVLTLWGSTTPACGFTPYNQPPDNSILSGVECQPCTIAGCEDCKLGDLRCMRNLTPAYIVNKIYRTIESK